MQYIQSFINQTHHYPLVQLLLTLLVFLFYLVARRFIFRGVLKRALLHNFDQARAVYIKKVAGVALGLVFIIFTGVIWQVSLEGLSVYIASILTVVGIGFFATWSILSNITAAVILFFFFPLKIGSKVRINDGENSAHGTVTSLTLFSITILREDGTEVYYPNNVAIQKSVSHEKETEA